MNRRFSKFSTLLTAVALPTIAVASGAADHMHKTQSGGHAAALGQPAASKDAKRTVNVDMGDMMRFTPEKIEIRKGETVRFIVQNSGMLKHEMVLGTMAELKAHGAMMAKIPNMEHADPNAISVDPGKTGEFAWKFTKTGTFDFACLLPGHFESGMKGKIIVKP